MSQHPPTEDPVALTNAGRATTEAARAALWTGILGVAKHLNNKSTHLGVRRSAVIQLRDGGAAMPVYFIGCGLAEFNLAQAIVGNHPIFAVEIPWRPVWRDLVEDEETEGLPSLAELVAPYTAAIAAHTQTDRCMLIGYSFAGLMAFEAAHQLALCGIAVDTVILIDAPATYPKSHQFAWQKLQEIWRRSATAGTADRTAPTTIDRLVGSGKVIQLMLADKIRRRVQNMADSIKSDPAPITPKVDELGRPLPWPMIEQLYDNALKTYSLHRLDCRSVLFRAARRDECPSCNLDRHLGWDNMFGKGLDIIDVPGNHLSLMREQRHIATLARTVSAWLKQTYADAVVTQR
jgi:thioesterase domain-containing protein